MNKIFVILVAIFLSSCECYLPPCCYPSYPPDKTLSAKIYFINETSEPILSFSRCIKKMAPKDTFIIRTKINLWENKTIDNFPLPSSICTMFYQNGKILKEEKGLRDIQNYEDRKEVRPSVFEFTFRFTEERKAKAIFSGYYPIKATFYFINETDDPIIARNYENIAPKDTLKVSIGSLFVTKGKPSIDNFSLPSSIYPMLYKDGEVLKCEKKLQHLIYYEDRKEVEPLSFEFTFRFTEERKTKATACNY